MRFFYQSRWSKGIAVCLLINFLTTTCLPVQVFALTGGPSQPEVQSFSPVGTSDMVDVSSGDFTYNIPLMDVGGYPINITYNAGITPDQEASWVGLGWNINPGVINRNMRGLPDDFNGDPVTKEFNIKDNLSYGVSGGFNAQLFGFGTKGSGVKVGLSLGVGISYNNYTGMGTDLSLNPTISIGNKAKDGELTGGLGITAGSQSGLEITPSVGIRSISKGANHLNRDVSSKIGLAFNSREGFKDLSLSSSLNSEKDIKKQPLLIKDGEFVRKSFTKNGGSSISLTPHTYMPTSDMHFNNFGVSFSASDGGAAVGLFAGGYISGYFSGQFLTENTRNMNGYGYMYQENANKNNYNNAVGTNGNDLCDFNREKQVAFNVNTPALPVTNFTYDIYSVSGQGIGGMYRLHRNDVGVVQDPDYSNMGGANTGGGLQFGLGELAHFAVQGQASLTTIIENVWNNPVTNALQFQEGDNSQTNPLYEKVYFAQAGEKTVNDNDAFFKNMGGYDPVAPPITHAGNTMLTSSVFAYPDGKVSKVIDGANTVKHTRQKRNQSISVLTAADASKYALVKNVESYSYNGFNTDVSGNYSLDQNTTQRSNTSLYPGHHISEITALRPDGSRYIYGIPAYNRVQKECTFAIDNQQVFCSSGQVTYNHGQDNSIHNKSGLDHYYEKTSMPAYAHSYLLTAIVSSDYVDLTGDGPSDDDYGTYTKINYTKAISNYQWRTPLTNASYNEGLKSNPLSNASNTSISDDKGSYLYGQKEVWYVHSIETKTHVAEFTLDYRLDGNGVSSEEGGLFQYTDQNALLNSVRKLTKITLYSKSDKRKNQGNATPIKVVNFEYDYSLCTNIENNAIRQDGYSNTGSNNSGKLTLKKIYFTYGTSYKAKFNAYTFNYDSKSNPSYNGKAYDRWGNYKFDGSDGCADITSALTNAEYPYVAQDTTISNQNARAWNLSDINLPSGGTIHVDYEADDYGYVQDKPATQMFKVVKAVSQDPSQSYPGTLSSTAITTEQLYNGNTNNQYLIFQLQQPLSSAAYTPTAASALVKQAYLGDIQNMGFRFLVNLDKSGTTSSYEFVSGYAGAIDAGVVKVANGVNYSYGYVKLTTSSSATLTGSGASVHPVSKAAWQFARLYLPRIAYGNSPNIDPTQVANPVAVIKSLASSLSTVTQFFSGFNNYMRNNNQGNDFIANKSWIRLYSPIHKKLGGGHRVRRVVLNDQWQQLTNLTNYKNSQYGQEYDYTSSLKIQDATQTISSGVASYEPLLGSDENVLHQPVNYNDPRLFLVPSNDYYLEEPFGESFFPSPTVVYSKVKVSNLKNTGVTKNATGSVVHEFYTSKDYPTLTRRFTPQPTHVGSRFSAAAITKIDAEDNLAASHGYVIETNDMHGKEKAQWVYQEGKPQPISGIEYLYKGQTTSRIIQGDTLLNNQLGNITNVIYKYKDASGSRIKQKTIGVDFDVVMDSKIGTSNTYGGGVNGNLEAFFALLEIDVPVVLPTVTYEKTSFRYMVLTKVISRSGLLDQVIAHDLGSSVSTQNLAYDAETGEVLLTKTTNGFDDPVYSFTYPAHWAYDRMGAAYRNIGLSMNITSPSNIANASSYFVAGDVLSVSGMSTPYTVTSVAVNAITAVDGGGNALSGASTITVIRSGRKNMQTIPVGMVTSLQNPMIDLNGDGTYDDVSFTTPLVSNSILSAGAVEFAERWKTFCDCAVNVCGTYNPYQYGLLGNWRALKSHTYLTERNQSLINNNTNIRKDGTFKSFNPFWLSPSQPGTDWAVDSTNWTWVTQVTAYSPFGMELENQDALGRYSAAVYGYNSSLPIAVGNNTKYQEIAFDGFEDYDYSQCFNDHFSFRQFVLNSSQSAIITNSQSHTGKRSIQINGPNSAGVTKTLINCK